MTNKQVFGLGSLLVAVLVAVVVFFSSFYVNDEYERSIVTRMGEIHTTTGPGFHWKAPFVDSVHKADTRMQQINYDGELVATLDGQTINVDLTINHRIQPDSSDNLIVLYEQFGNQFNYDATLLRRMSLDRMKSVIGRYSMEDIMPNRDQIRTQALNDIREATMVFGIDVIDVQISNFTFSPAYRERLEEVARARARAAEAQQDARAREWNANGVIEDARGRSESAKLEADAQAYARLENARSNAEAIRLEGQANAEAMRLQNEVLRESSGLVEYTIAQAMANWDGSVPQFMSGSGNGEASIFPFLNLKDLQQ